MVNTEALKNLISQKGLKMSHICRATGINRTSLWKKINGMTEFKSSEVVKMCEVLGITTKREWDAYFFN